MLPLSENEFDEMIAVERSRGAPPLTDWGSLSERLRAEGLIRTPSITARMVMSPWMRVAAAILLAVGGAAAGRVSAGASPLPASTAQSAEQGPPTQGVAASPTGAQLTASGSSAVSATPDFKSPEEAWEVLNRAGDQYQRASAYLSASNTEVPLPAEPEQYRTRLAALDNVMSEMRDALKAAPQDPVINQYYLATVGAREATLRQMGTTLPATARLNRF